MEPDEELPIGELARRAGVTPRTVRYYTSEGLLAPPATRGRYAAYGSAHLRRLRLIARLKADYLPLSAIRQRLATMGAAEEARLLGEGPAGPPPPHAGPRLYPRSPGHQGAAGMLAERPASYGLPGDGSAAEQQAHFALPGDRPAAAAPPEADALASGSDPFRLTPSQLPLGRVEFFPDAPEQPAEAGPAPGAGWGAPELWQLFVVAPGVELRVREPISPRRRREIEALLGALRDRLQSEEQS